MEETPATAPPVAVETTLLSLPPECHACILLAASLREIGRAASVCKDWRAVVQDAALWHTLLRVVWRVEKRVEFPRHTFLARLREYRVHCTRQRLNAVGSAWLSESTAECDADLARQHATPHAAGGGGALDAHSVQQLEYTGSLGDAPGNETVGIAAGLLRTWPVGPSAGYAAAEGAVTLPAGGGVQLRYFETEIANQGAHGYIAVGWCRMTYPQRCRQPGWERHSYGYHGDDGRAYSGCGYGKRFGPTFGTGQVVGSGIVEVHGDSYEEKGAYIFYTVDGEVVGTPFKRVPRPERLHPCAAPAQQSPSAAHFSGAQFSGAADPAPPLSLSLGRCVGLHSPGESVRLHFGGSAAGFLASAPPAPPAPFAFDLNAFVASLTPHPGLVPPAPREPPSEPTEPTPEAQELGRRIQEALEAEEAAAAAEGEGEGEGDASDDDESADEDPGSDGEEAEGAGLAASLQELLSLINDEADDSEATMAEMRFYLHSRLGPQAHNLHASWGASSINDLNATRLRHLCALVLQHE